jgi:hypothetical protein
MKNLDSVLVAYLAGWAIFFFFYLSVERRTAALRGEIERLRKLVEKGK